jgi:hypothetical protein
LVYGVFGDVDEDCVEFSFWIRGILHINGEDGREDGGRTIESGWKLDLRDRLTKG